MKTKKTANGSSRGKNKVFAGLIAEDVPEIDPCYKAFLEHLSEDGNTYVLAVPNGDHGVPASVRYGEEQMSCGDTKVKDSTGVPRSLPRKSRGGQCVKRPGQTSGRVTNVNVCDSSQPRASSVNKAEAIDESYAAFLSLMKIKDGVMVIELEPGRTIVYEQEVETPCGYDELRTGSTKEQDHIMNVLENMEGENGTCTNENKVGLTDNTISEHGIDRHGPAANNFDSLGFISTIEHSFVPCTESSDFDVLRNDQGSHFAVCSGVPSTFDEKLDCVLSQPYDQNEYEELLIKATDRKPVSRQRHLRSASKRYATGVIGLSYFDHYPGLAIQMKSADCDERRLSLLRKFFFWLENLCHEGAHMPWVPKGLACDPITTDD